MMKKYIWRNEVDDKETSNVYHFVIFLASSNVVRFSGLLEYTIWNHDEYSTNTPLKKNNNLNIFLEENAFHPRANIPHSLGSRRTPKGGNEQFFGRVSKEPLVTP